MKKLVNKKKLLVAITVVLLVLVVYVSVGLASKGSELVSIEEKAHLIESENRQLTAELIAEMSLTKISQKARELGMIEPEELVYLTKEPRVAKLP